MNRLRLAAAGLLLALPACATVARQDLVWIGAGGSENCFVAVEGRRFPLPAQLGSLEAHLARLARRSAGAVLGGEDETTALRCWTFALHAAQRAGFARLGFVTPAAAETPAD